MKKWIALLAVVLSLFLAACGGEPAPAETEPSDVTTTEPTTEATEPSETEPVTEETTFANDRFDPDACSELIGVWTVPLVLDGELLNLEGMEATVEMTFAYRLNADGTYTRGVEPGEFEAAITAYEDAVGAFMLDRLYAKFTAEKQLEGVSKKKIPELWEQEGKAPAEDQTNRFVEGLYLDYRFAELNTEGDYYEEDGVLWFSREGGSYESCSYTLSEEGLTITGVDNADIYRQVKLEIPLTLVKAE